MLVDDLKQEIISELENLPDEKIVEVREFLRSLGPRPSNAVTGDPFLRLLVGLNEAERRQRTPELLEWMKQNSIRLPAGAPSVVDLIREDRER